MSQVTLQDRVLAHLHKYTFVRKDTVYDAPKEITQEGIGEAIGITRSHASILLGRMVNEHLLSVSYSAIKHARKPLKRMIYHLTEWGKIRYEERKKECLEDGIDLDHIIANINECTEADIKKLDRKDYDTIGMICVLRTIPIRSQISNNVGILVFDGKGRVNIKAYQRKRILSCASEDDLKRWHSLAADWCIDYSESMRERLYHLSHAGRGRESVKLIKSNRYEILDIYDRETAEIAIALAKEYDDFDIRSIAARLAIDGCDLEEAETLISMVYEKDECIAGSFEAEMLLRKSLNKEALEIARKSFNGDFETSLTLGKCLIENGMYDEARANLERAKRLMIENSCAFRMDEILSYEAVIENNLYHNDNALKLIDAAINASRNDKRRSSLVALSDRIKSEDGVLLQCIDI